mmetsp:Transcript_49630/g.106316  ORF Transcript_49630/g.106316 Transcript_49630/m.106316 type:complete len:83 (-) Transcript_49630:116-364(-)
MTIMAKANCIATKLHGTGNAFIANWLDTNMATEQIIQQPTPVLSCTLSVANNLLEEHGVSLSSLTAQLSHLKETCEPKSITA